MGWRRDPYCVEASIGMVAVEQIACKSGGINQIVAGQLRTDGSKNGLDKSSYNVQFVNFKLLHWEVFSFACLHFQNVSVAGKLLGKFDHPRLK